MYSGIEQNQHKDGQGKADEPAKFIQTARVGVEFYGEELDLMEEAAKAANKSLSEFAAEAALEYAEIYLRVYGDAEKGIRLKHGLSA